MLKDYLIEQHISMYSLAKKSGVAYSTINDLANGRVDVDNCKVSLLCQLAKALTLSMDDVYDICQRDLTVYSKTYDTKIQVSVKNKMYYADFEYEGEAKHIKVCEAGADHRHFIKELALWDAEDNIEKQNWEELNEILANEKK